MKKQGKTLLILLAALIVVAGAFAAVTIINKNNAATEQAEEEAEPLLTLSAEDITGITYTLEGGSLSFEKSGESFVLSGEPDFPLDTAKVDAMCTALTGLTAIRTLPAPEAAEDYGLESGADTIAVSTAAGEYTLTLGTDSAQAGGTYLEISDREGLFLVDSAFREAFSYALTGLMKADELPAIDAARVSLISVSAPELQYSLERTYDNDGLYLSKNYYYYYNDGEKLSAAETSEGEGLFTAACGMTPLECVLWSPTEDALESRGLKDPSTVEISYEEDISEETTNADGETETSQKTVDKKLTLSFGNVYEDEDGGIYRYMMFTGSDMVYIVENSSALALLAPDAAGLTPLAVCDPDFYSLTGMELEYKGESYAFEFYEDEEGKTKARVNGEDISAVYLESFYIDMTAVKREGIASETDAPGEQLFKAVLHRDTTDAYRDITLTYSAFDSNFCFASVSCRDQSFLVNKRDIEAIGEGLLKLLAGN